MADFFRTGFERFQLARDFRHRGLLPAHDVGDLGQRAPGGFGPQHDRGGREGNLHGPRFQAGQEIVRRLRNFAEWARARFGTYGKVALLGSSHGREQCMELFFFVHDPITALMASRT